MILLLMKSVCDIYTFLDDTTIVCDVPFCLGKVPLPTTFFRMSLSDDIFTYENCHG